MSNPDHISHDIVENCDQTNAVGVCLMGYMRSTRVHWADGRPIALKLLNEVRNYAGRGVRKEYF
jgi:hypothetical protein